MVVSYAYLVMGLEFDFVGNNTGLGLCFDFTGNLRLRIMPKATKKNGVAGHQVFKDRAKNRVDDLQGMFSDLQSARKESRSNDVMLLENQVHQMLKEWKSELNQPSPASSFQVLMMPLWFIAVIEIVLFLNVGGGGNGVQL